MTLKKYKKKIKKKLQEAPIDSDCKLMQATIKSEHLGINTHTWHSNTTRPARQCGPADWRQAHTSGFVVVVGVVVLLLLLLFCCYFVAVIVVVFVVVVAVVAHRHDSTLSLGDAVCRGFLHGTLRLELILSGRIHI
ncbi:unnamed protein product [Polarella glacialis]|uniref:Uncharacterized protein n=1 Tax=Polarella glacialis TaxID=89957 RepID=A0A813JDQ1_POLGL|nr:unnamed protein product [Polarella glacialis]